MQLKWEIKHPILVLIQYMTLQNHFPNISSATILQWATINGAKALQWDNGLGSFEKNKTPGIVLINKNTWESKRIL